MGTEMSRKQYTRAKAESLFREIAKRLIAPIKCILSSLDVVHSIPKTRTMYVIIASVSPRRHVIQKKEIFVFERITTLVDILHLNAAFIDDDVRIKLLDAATILISTTATFLPP